MKPFSWLNIILLSIIFISCHHDNKIKERVKDKYYYLSSSKRQPFVDTTYIDSLDHNISGLIEVDRKGFDNVNSGVIKYRYDSGPVDSESLSYYTDEFGIIYTKNITWGNYSRLHCTNESIDNKISLYIDNILASQSLVLAGEDIVLYAGGRIELYKLRVKNNSH